MIARRPRRWVRLTWRANPHWHHLPGELVPHLFIVSVGTVGYVEAGGPIRLLYLGLALAAGALIAWALLLVLLGRGRS
jgi:hypothetical protein